MQFYDNEDFSTPETAAWLIMAFCNGFFCLLLANQILFKVKLIGIKNCFMVDIDSCPQHPQSLIISFHRLGLRGEKPLSIVLNYSLFWEWGQKFILSGSKLKRSNGNKPTIKSCGLSFTEKELEGKSLGFQAEMRYDGATLLISI